MNNYQYTSSEFIEKYKKEFGERKFEKARDKIYSSNKVSKLIQKSKELRLPPSDMDYLPLLHEIPFFLFSRAETIALGAVLAIERWDNECNKIYKILTDEDLYFLLLKIFQETNKFKLNR